MVTSSGPAAASTRSGTAWFEPTKGLAMVMVVAYHSTLYLQSAGVGAVLGRAKAVFQLFPMPAFFLIAGMFAARQAGFSFRQLWERRLRTLLYLYVLWSIIRTLFYLFVPGLNSELGEIPATDPRALPLILVWPSSSYWFLYALFLFTLVRWVVAKLPVWVQLSGSAVVSTLFTSGLVGTGNLGWDRIGALFFFFVLGAVASTRIRKLVAEAGAAQAIAVMALFLVAVGLIAVGLDQVPPVVLVGQTAAVAVGILCCVWLARHRAFSLLSTLGAASLKVYLLHLYIIVPAVALISLLDPDWPRWADILVQIALTAVTLVGTLQLASLTSRARWLYLPPAFLRRTPRKRSAHPAGGPTPTPRTAGTGGVEGR
jgi:uncharacterized membrane protein YcfT